MQTSTSSERWLTRFSSQRLYWALLALNLAATALVGWATFNTIGGDHYTYLGYAEGLAQGRYSYWYFLPEYAPDTFRNPGYPLFLWALQSLGIGESGIRLVQIGLYLCTIGLVLRTAARCERPQAWLVRNLLLLLLLPNVQLAYFAAVIFPEIVLAFLLAVYVELALSWHLGSWGRTVALALVAGLIFQVRPAFIFFPLAHLALDWWRTRPRAAFSWVQAASLLALYAATMLPYAVWNQQHHGVLKVTPLEGGAGNMQLGFWALRMPGYVDTHYWGNWMGEEIIPFSDPADIPAHIAAYNAEWAVIQAQCRPLLTERDQRLLPLMVKDQRNLFRTYSAPYTLCREKALMQANWADIAREPGYYALTRAYTFVRLWVTGIQLNAWQSASTTLAKLKLLYPMVVSGLTFVLAAVSIAWAISRSRWFRGQPTAWLSLALVAYFGLIHLPFSIQARYTVPVRPWLLLLIALALAAWLWRKERSSSPPGRNEPVT